MEETFPGEETTGNKREYRDDQEEQQDANKVQKVSLEPASEDTKAGATEKDKKGNLYEVLELGW